METEETLKSRSFDRLSQIIITECVCIGLILVSVLVIKYFFKGTYTELKAWYEAYICDNTEIDEVIGKEESLSEV